MTIVDEPIAYTPKEAGKRSGLGVAAIEQMMAVGDLPYLLKPPGNRYRLILHEDLMEALRARRVDA